MRTKHIATVTLAALLLLSALTFPGFALAEDGDEDWGNAHWIWSSAETDRCETALWIDPNRYESLLIPAADPMDSLIVQTMKPIKLLTYDVPLASEFDVWMDFRRDFTLAQKPDSAVLKIACDSKYWLWVNGEIVVRDGALRRGPNANDTYYETVEIGPWLKEGENSICVQVWYWRSGGFDNNASGCAGLLISSEIIDQSTQGRVETGDGLWYALRDPAFGKGATFNYRAEAGTAYDARRAIDWTNPEYVPEASGDGWNLASPIGLDRDNPGKVGDEPWNALWPRTIPQMKDYGLTEAAYTEENGVYTVVLPYNCQFTAYLKLGAGTKAGQTITITTDTTDKAGNDDSYITRAGEQEYEAPNWRNGDELYFTIPEGVEVIALGYRETGYPVTAGKATPFIGYFNSIVKETDPSFKWFRGGRTWSEDEVSADNNFYDEMWKKAARTLYVTIRDTYMDCPDRERSQYIGDAVNEMEEAFYALGAEVDPLTEKAIRNISDWQLATEVSGRTYYMMSNVRPGNNAGELWAQSLGLAHATANYYRFTGKTETAKAVYTNLFNYLTNYDLISEGAYAGLVAPREPETVMFQSGNWFDWGSNQDTLIETTLWWYISAQGVRELMDIDGVAATDEQRTWLSERMRSVEDHFETFWNAELNAYATPWSKETWSYPAEKAGKMHLVDDRVNALAVVCGLAPEDRYPLIRNVFMGTDSSIAYENASIYMEKYVLEALYKMGYAADAQARMYKRYRDIVNDDTSSTLPEYWNGGTKNHGWSGGSLIVLSRYAAGIEPVEPGYAAWRVTPQLGTFAGIDTRVPSAVGNIDLAIEDDEAQNVLTMTVTSPGGKAELWVPVSEGREVSVLSGSVEVLGMRTAYGQSYEVFAAVEPGTYAFEARGEAPAEAEAHTDEAESNANSAEPLANGKAKNGTLFVYWIIGVCLAAAVATAVVIIIKKSKE